VNLGLSWIKHVTEDLSRNVNDESNCLPRSHDDKDIVRINDCISQLAKRLIVTLTGINNIETIQLSDLVFKTCMDVSTK
jgi:hypothetical protein